jgi:hypothetical protein
MVSLGVSNFDEFWRLSENFAYNQMWLNMVISISHANDSIHQKLYFTETREVVTIFLIYSNKLLQNSSKNTASFRRYDMYKFDIQLFKYLVVKVNIVIRFELS